MLPSPARGQSKSALTAAPVSRRSAGFQIEEATIDDVHAAIRQGRTTCRDVVQAYVQRARFSPSGGGPVTVLHEDTRELPTVRHT